MTQQSIADAIAAAQNAAAAAVNASANLPSTQTGGTAVGAPVSGGPLGLDDLLAGGVAVDHWLKLSAFGLVVGDKTKPMDTIEAYIDLSQIAYCYAVKYTLNNQATYHRSYDRVKDSRGENWADVLVKAKQIDEKSYEYRSAEIPLVAAADIIGKDGKTVAVKAGETLGLTLPTTGWRPFEAFIKSLVKAKIDPKGAIVKLTLGHEVKSKPGVNDWAVPSFLNFEEVDVMPVFDTVH